MDALDECHITTYHANTASVVGAIKEGLEQDGLGNLVLRVTQDDKSGAGKATRSIKRRPKFAKTEIYLPKVMIVGAPPLLSCRAPKARFFLLLTAKMSFEGLQLSLFRTMKGFVHVQQNR